MTGPKGNSEFCFPVTFNVPQDEAEGNIEGRGETKLTVSRGASHWVFLYSSQLKNSKKCEKMICLTPTVAVLAVQTAVKPSYPTETIR